MESSGTYGDAFRQSLEDAGLPVHRVSGKAVKDDIIEQRTRIQQCRRELKNLTKDHQPIQSQASAVGLITACVLWMCLGDPQKYGSAGAYRKAMGLNLTERSSGMHQGKLKLSKRGQRLPRKWLYFSSLRWMREPSVKIRLENKKRRDGGHGGKAATGIMRKLAAAAWHAGQGEVFDPRRLFPGSKCDEVPRRPLREPFEDRRIKSRRIMTGQPDAISDAADSTGHEPRSEQQVGATSGESAQGRRMDRAQSK
jgi:hypothetical protein